MTRQSERRFFLWLPADGENGERHIRAVRTRGTLSLRSTEEIFEDDVERSNETYIGLFRASASPKKGFPRGAFLTPEDDEGVRYTVQSSASAGHWFVLKLSRAVFTGD